MTAMPVPIPRRKAHQGITNADAVQEKIEIAGRADAFG